MNQTLRKVKRYIESDGSTSFLSVAAVLAVIASVTLGAGEVHAMTREELNAKVTDVVAHREAMLRTAEVVITTCNEQYEANNTEHFDDCAEFARIYDKHITAALEESSAQIQNIMGLNFTAGSS